MVMGKIPILKVSKVSSIFGVAEGFEFVYDIPSIDIRLVAVEIELDLKVGAKSLLSRLAPLDLSSS